MSQSFICEAAISVVVVLIILPVYSTIIEPKDSTTSSEGKSPHFPNTLTAGGNGSMVTMGNGT